ncbi:arylsulfotransferase family protein [Shumkonia mesophila]|uniref:arylsulfotransferase family protein n=1 Tax=Shumkonia mesophila TaxID=2838854 RepID=UPI0029343212|nr:arylsulfotransferase family protein [Shumkonia mesophila]
MSATKVVFPSRRKPDRDRVGGILERAGQGLFFLAMGFLAFAAGAFAVLSQTFPSQPLRDAYRAAVAYIDKVEMSSDPLATDQWRKARTAALGVTAYEAGRAFPGYTLYTSGDGPYARLITMDGRTLHEWNRPYSTVWNEQAAIKNPQPDPLIFMTKAEVLPNGDLLAIYEAAGDTPWGYGMVKLNKNSEVIWSYLQPVHHDFDIAPDGRIFTLTQEFTSEKIKGFTTLGSPRLDDFLVTLSPDGRELKKISLTHALAQSRYDGFVHATPAFSTEDPLHTNAVEYIDKAKARRFAVGGEGHVVVSFRDIGVLAVIDPESGEVEWATRGPWVGQHDPRVLDNGDILVFDNFGTFDKGNDSRILAFNPKTMEVTWRYEGDAERPFSSEIRGSIERLANGNTLITESDGGRLLEVARDGTIAWEYVNPVRSGEGNRYIPVVSGAQRVIPGRLEPAFRDSIERTLTEKAR